MIDHRVTLCFTSEEVSNCFPQRLHQFTFPSTRHKDSNFSTSSLTTDFFFFNNSHPNGCEMFSHSLLNEETVSYQNASGFPFHWKQSPKFLLSPQGPLGTLGPCHSCSSHSGLLTVLGICQTHFNLGPSLLLFLCLELFLPIWLLASLNSRP